MLLFQIACGTREETCADRLFDAAGVVKAQWPNADVASKSAFSKGCEWEWSHKRRSVDGIGATMVLLSEDPGVDDVFDLDIDVHAGGRLESPSLLFFDQTAEALDTWELIGMGYHFDYEPCTRPDTPCFTDEDFFVHEAGYHTVIIGAGGMTLATDEDLVAGSEATLDAAGCSDVEEDDLTSKFNTVKHGRAWDVHVWFVADGEPVLAVADPEERWKDAVDRVEVDGGAFFVPDDEACACAPSNPAGDTAEELPPTCGVAQAPTEEPPGCTAAVVVLLLPGLGLARGRRLRACRQDTLVRCSPCSP